MSDPGLVMRCGSPGVAARCLVPGLLQRCEGGVPEPWIGIATPFPHVRASWGWSRGDGNGHEVGFHAEDIFYPETFYHRDNPPWLQWLHPYSHVVWALPDVTRGEVVAFLNGEPSTQVEVCGIAGSSWDRMSLAGGMPICWRRVGANTVGSGSINVWIVRDTYSVNFDQIMRSLIASMCFDVEDPDPEFHLTYWGGSWGQTDNIVLMHWYHDPPPGFNERLFQQHVPISVSVVVPGTYDSAADMNANAPREATLISMQWTDFTRTASGEWFHRGSCDSSPGHPAIAADFYCYMSGGPLGGTFLRELTYGDSPGRWEAPVLHRYTKYGATQCTGGYPNLCIWDSDAPDEWNGIDEHEACDACRLTYGYVP